MDHDQRFKTLIREFFADFLRLFLSVWGSRFDLSTIEWLEQEMLPNPPEGSRHRLDMVAKLKARRQVTSKNRTASDEWLTLIHIEIESPDRTTNLKPRLPAYYIHLRDKHNLPVLPIVIYLKVGLDGIGVDIYEEEFWELTVLCFRYLYVGLPGLKAVDYVEGDNWLGVALAALMRIPKDKIVSLGEQALRRLHESPLNEQQRFLLTECVEAYLPLNEEQQLELEARLLAVPSERVKTMNKTTFEKGMEKGVQDTLLRIGAKRFKQAPSKEFESRIRSIKDIERLEELTDRVMDAGSWDELLGST
jgi:hypothetical protein